MVKPCPVGFRKEQISDGLMVVELSLQANSERVSKTLLNV
jgi:hypothetical protein